MKPVDAQTFVREEMAAIFRSAQPARPHEAKRSRGRRRRRAPGAGRRCRGILGTERREPGAFREPVAPQDLDLRIKVAGFGGQGVLMLGEVLAEAGLEAGYEVSWLPSYGPEMRSGTSNCHVRLSSHAHRFAAGLPAERAAGHERAVAAQVPAGGRAGRHWCSTTARRSRRIARATDVRFMARPFTELADELGASEGRQHRDARARCSKPPSCSTRSRWGRCGAW